MLNAETNALAANDQTVANLKMNRRDQQIALVKALGGGFDATADSAIDGSGKPRSCRALKRGTSTQPPGALK